MFKIIDSVFRELWPICFRLDETANFRVMVEVNAWCDEQFGDHHRDRTFTAGGMSIWFRDPAQATVFRLKWC